MDLQRRCQILHGAPCEKSEGLHFLQFLSVGKEHRLPKNPTWDLSTNGQIKVCPRHRGQTILGTTCCKALGFPFTIISPRMSVPKLLQIGAVKQKKVMSEIYGNRRQTKTFNAVPEPPISHCIHSDDPPVLLVRHVRLLQKVIDGVAHIIRCLQDWYSLKVL